MRSTAFAFVTLASAMMLGCASPPSIMRDLDGNPPGAHRLIQVLAVADRNSLASDAAYERLVRDSFDFVSPSWKAGEERRRILSQLQDAGVSDADLERRAVVIGRVYCCGGPYEFIYKLFAYAPPATPVVKYDILDINLGREPEQGRGGQVNTVTRLVHRYKQPPYNCRWVPDSNRLWNRILYCDGMKEEGWTLHAPLLSEYGHTWLKVPDPRAER